MIDDTSAGGGIDGQLLTLQRVVATAAPPRSEIEAIVRHNRVRRTRVRRAAGALAAAVVVGTSALVFTTLDGTSPDLSTRVESAPEPDVESGPDVESPDPDTGGSENVCGGGLAGPDPAGEGLRDDEILQDDLAGVGDALEARFPSCFGGIVRTGPQSADLYVVELAPDVIATAQEMVGPGFALTALPSDNAFADIRALKARIDEDAGQLHAAGVETSSTGIRITSRGPRVWVGISPYTPEAAEQIEDLYGADKVLVDDFGATIPG